MAGEAVEAIRHAAQWFDFGRDGVHPIVDAIGDADVVLIGEATHGTHEFYRVRADITETLIEQKGFNLVAVEADWPDAYRANRWVRGASHDPDATAALGDFTRFPRWMWRNDVVVDFLTWLHEHNQHRDPSARVGFYGLVSTAFTRPSPQFWATSPKSILRRLAALDIDTPASNTSPRTRRRMGMRRPSGSHARVRTMSLRS